MKITDKISKKIAKLDRKLEKKTSFILPEIIMASVIVSLSIYSMYILSVLLGVV